MTKRKTLDRVDTPDKEADKSAPEADKAEGVSAEQASEQAAEVPDGGSETVHGGEQAESESSSPAADAGLSDVSQVAGELGFRLAVSYTAAVDRLIRDCPKGDAVSARERDVLKSAHSAIAEVAGNPDQVNFEVFLRTQEGSDNFPMTFTMTLKPGNGDQPWIGIIDTDESGQAQH